MSTHSQKQIQLFLLILLVGGVSFFLFFSKSQEAKKELSDIPTQEKLVFNHPSPDKNEVFGAGSVKPENREKFPFIHKEGAFKGFTIFPEVGTGLVKLLNMSGEIVHEWNFDVDRIRLKPNGNVVALHGSKWGLTVSPWKDLMNVIREYDWNANLLWEYHLPERIHHDFRILPNGNIISLQRKNLPVSYGKTLTNPRLKGLKIRSDEVFEVDQRKNKVWSWYAHDHLDRNSCGKFQCPSKMKPLIARKKKPFDWTHTNTVSIIPENKWFDNGDTRFRPGNLMILPRNMSEVYIIEKSSGDIVWRYQGTHRGGLEFGHEAHMIAPDLPGAGNVLIFDNGVNRGESIVLEIDPTTQEPIWLYENGKDFFSRVQGAVQRLPNGNTLISEDLTPRVFEITREKEIVWQVSGETMRIARAHRYAPDYTDKFTDLPLE